MPLPPESSGYDFTDAAGDIDGGGRSEIVRKTTDPHADHLNKHEITLLSEVDGSSLWRTSAAQ